MGNSVPSIAKKRFDEYEIEQIKDTFGTLAKEKVKVGTPLQAQVVPAMDKKTFTEHLDLKDHVSFADRLFAAFDQDKNGLIDFREFSTGLALLVRGSHESKLKFIFQVFDMDRSGDVDRSELEFLLSNSFFNANNFLTISQDQMHSAAHLQSNVTELCDDAFNTADLDKNGKLSQKEFIRWGLTCYPLKKFIESFQDLDTKRAGWNDISDPTGVQHITHLDAKKITPEMVELFKKAGIKKKELKNPETMQFLLDVILEHAGQCDSGQATDTELRAIYSYTKNRDDELEFSKGATFVLISEHPNGWYQVRGEDGKLGWIPGNYVEKITSEQQPVVRPDEAQESGEVEVPKAPTLPSTKTVTIDESKNETRTGNTAPVTKAKAFLSQIRAGTHLRHVQKSNIAKEHLESISATDKDTLSGLLSKAINSRRKYLHECGQDAEEEDDEDWDDW